MALSQRLIKLVFTRMLVRYGTAWASKWRGVDEEAVHADWAHELDGFGETAIRYGLEHLPPDFPPNSAQFKALCINRPEPSIPRLSAPKANPRVVKAIVERLAAAQRKVKPLDWAYALQEREKAGEKLTPTQRLVWRNALAEAPAAGIMEFNGVPAEALPPGMRGQA
jgi:hypothetical protein